MVTDSPTEEIVYEDVPIRPAATVIPLRDGGSSIEVLELWRDTNLAFHGGRWVFPGGLMNRLSDFASLTARLG